MGLMGVSAIAASDMPTDQSKFIEVVSAAQADSDKAANDMQRGGVLAMREKKICQLIGKAHGAVKNWVGEVEKVDSNSDGMGILQLKIADRIHVQTVNNGLSDIVYKTMLTPGTQIFNDAAALAPGQQVVFSGSFLRDAENKKTVCIGEQSITLDGKLSEPEFVFRFSAIASR